MFQKANMFIDTILKIAKHCEWAFSKPDSVCEREKKSTIQGEKKKLSGSFRIDFKGLLRWASETRLIPPSATFLDLSSQLTEAAH